jgi:hypothetical protein
MMIDVVEARMRLKIQGNLIEVWLKPEEPRRSV